MPLILYRWLSGWGLPSISPACIQIEAYLRLCQADFEVESCSSGSTSPSGQLPALETPQELVDAAAPSGSEFDSARAVMEHLRHSRQDLDAGLSPAQKAEAAAFAALVEAKLEPAVLWTTWCEAESFSKHTQAAYGAGLPFPLNYILPYTQRRRVQRLLKHTNAEKVYSDAAQACSAITERLSMSSGHGPFFFGANPCSFDALLYGLLAFQQASPVTSPEMKQQIMGNQALTLYVSRISNDFFAAAVPTAPPSTSEEWQARAQAAAQSRPRERQQEKKQQTAEEQQMQRRGWYWLAAAGAAVTAFVLLSGQYVTFDIYPVVHMDLDDEEDDD